MPNAPSRIRTAEIKRAIKAVEACGLKVRQVTFDENGLPIVNVGENEKPKVEGKVVGHL